jgi:hypothetical protein
MGRTVNNREFFLNYSGHHRAGPNTRMKSIGHGSTIQDFGQHLQLLTREFLGTTTTVPLQNPFHPVLLSMVQPERNFRTVHFEEVGNFRSFSPLHIEDHSVQSTCHPIGPFLDCLFTQWNEPLDCSLSSMDSLGLHGISLPDAMIPYVALFMQGYITC